MTEAMRYAQDWGNHCIRRRTVDGVWSTLAGKPFERGYQDGPGAVARFNNIARITVDCHTGDLIVSDRDNHCIRRVILITEGDMAVVTTIAGGGDGPLGEAGHAGVCVLFRVCRVSLSLARARARALSTCTHKHTNAHTRIYTPQTRLRV